LLGQPSCEHPGVSLAVEQPGAHDPSDLRAAPANAAAADGSKIKPLAKRIFQTFLLLSFLAPDP
jgi:hypothetical protein